MRPAQFLRRLFQRCNPLPDRAEEARLREVFRSSHAKFRSLLTANNNALEVMAEMEQMLRSGQPFGMTFVRSRCTALGVNVFKMIKLLQALSCGGYAGLTEAFRSVSFPLWAIVEKQPEAVACPHVLELREISKESADMVGEKMANLGEISSLVGLPVPDGFALTASASQHFLAAAQLRDEINRRLTICRMDDLEELHQTCAAIQQMIADAPMPEDLEREIIAAYRRLEARTQPDLLVAVRSSALGEDSAAASFAGQHRTQLNVSGDQLIQACKEIIASKYRSQAVIYRLQRGFRHQDVIMCVGCLAMVEARAGGVAYSRSPDDPRSGQAVIIAALGAAEQVVDGDADTDRYQMARQPPFARQAQEWRLNALESILTDKEASTLAEIAVRLEGHFGAPQDVEWAIDQTDRLVILQSRPLVFGRRFKQRVPASHVEDARLLFAGGVTVSGGAGCGPVFAVQSEADLPLVPPGAVLVVEHPLPDWAAALPAAAAVVSETGQAAAHLATVAREFGVPALFNVKGAAGGLSNGQTVTVDADACRIYDGRMEELLANPPPKPELMQGSPVHRILAEALRLITPLNLTDPASIYFQPSSCKTLHDLTRFCHEKAVSEMFSFGSKFRFAEKAAKQLAGDMPFQWWVIDLDDGFVQGYDYLGKFVHVSQIVSAPMLALWDGMTAVPWPGPPPLSVRGFGSILFQSTMNRELDPAVRSRLTEKNFFMVSKNFCSLSVRLGYHFALAEAHLSELLTENYVSFQFKGGAAEERRRMIRVQLLADILLQHGFRVEQKTDALVARIEKKAADLLTSRLKILGYLLIHTRQIDMVMNNPDMVEQYREKICADISMILAQEQSEAKETA